jgi:hypothetical protein
MGDETRSLMARFKGHHGYDMPVATMQHATKHDKQIAAIDREHAARNRGAGAPSREKKMDTRVGGSAKTTDFGNKGSRSTTGGAGLPGKKTQIPGLKKASGGSLDSRPSSR